MTVTEKYRKLEEYFPDILSGLTEIVQKYKLHQRFKAVSISALEFKKLQKGLELCELKILENWKNQDTDEFKLLCSVYFDIASTKDLSFETIDEIYEAIKIISIGYLGEHSHFVREYINSHREPIEQIKLSDRWNERLLVLSFKAIVNLVTKRNWKDISKAIDYVNQLRNEQDRYENTFLYQIKKEELPYSASELVSLYHFAKVVEILAQYLLEGKIENGSFDVTNKIKYHISKSKEFAAYSGNYILELLYQYFEAFAIKLAKNTIWNTLSGVNHWVTEFHRYITKKENHCIFELLYPQRESILKGELLNPAYKAFVVSLPTSSGKTLIAEYKILQALNQFKEHGGWVAYVVPTRALINQVYLRLKNDFEGINLQVEKASGALEIDGFENYLVENKGNNTCFDILVTTYEKLHLLIRQGLGTTDQRPLTLVIVDEAHNIEEESRGLNLELLLTTIKNDCREVNFVLLTPDIPNAEQIASWLGEDRGKEIHLKFNWWQPNERTIGALILEGRGKNFTVYLKTLNTIKGTYQIGENIPLIKNNTEKKKSEINSKLKLSKFTASHLLKPGSPIIILAAGIDETYQIADYLCEKKNIPFQPDNDVKLLQKFVSQELGVEFPLVKYLEKGIAIHNSALPDEIRFLIEQLMVEGKLLALVSTTTIAQGINFPVSAVILGAYNYPFKGPMPTRDFWNLAGRVGRIGQQAMGWIGIASPNNEALQKITNYVKEASRDLLSQLESAINVAFENQNEDFSRWLFLDERWSQLLQYISHLRLQVQDLETFINTLEEKIHATLGYQQINDDIKRKFLLSKLKEYARNLSLEDAKRSDSTGFSTISIRQMISKLSKQNITPSDWEKQKLFSESNQTMQKLVGIMLETYEIRKSLEEIKVRENVLDKRSISKLIINWVNGLSISEIANKIFNAKDRDSIEKTSKAIYKVILNAGCWGISALQKMPTSGIDWNFLSEIEKKKILNIPAYIYYGVNSDEAVLMRKVNVPRSIANQLGEFYKHEMRENIYSVSTKEVNDWIENLPAHKWENSLPSNSWLSAEEYKNIWKKLNQI